MLYSMSMWPFRSREKGQRIVKKVVVSLIIGGAIGSIVGRKLLEKHGAKEEEEGDEDEQKD